MSAGMEISPLVIFITLILTSLLAHVRYDSDFDSDAKVKYGMLFGFGMVVLFLTSIVRW